MKHLKDIKDPSDIKELSIDELKTLAAEIRRFLIKSISKTGGHLASNLGVVELTLALHYCFDSPEDKIIWDVGHQSYVHKMLTGRLEDFKNLRQLNGLSGFPKASESEHDAFDTGHSSTSISAALGFCAANELTGAADKRVIAVIGDGSMTGGLAYEAMNNAGRAGASGLIVILNDNQMSISANVGAVSAHLNNIRTAPYYLGAKADVHKLLDKLPFVGKRAASVIEKIKNTIKYALVPGVMFEELGFNYIGPVDGHDLHTLTEVMSKLRGMSGPVLLHVYTKKGKGYSQAENQPEAFHGVDSFNIKTGNPVITKLWDTYSDVFGQALVKLAASDKRIVAITAAMPEGTGLAQFEHQFPNRLFDVGIAEAHAVTFAAGLSKAGLIPVVAVYSSFLQRAYDQIVHDVCIQNLHVVFAVDRAGLVGADGETHQGIMDISYLSHIPNLTIMAPKNKKELQAMLAFAMKHNGPIAVRYPKGSASRVYRNIDNDIEYGVSETIEAGREIAVISVGAMMDAAERVCMRLRAVSYEPALINARFIKPVDKKMVRGLAKYKYIFVMEDNYRSGGYGSKILELMTEEDIPYSHFHIFAFPDAFIPQGGRDELLALYGLDADSMYGKIIETVSVGKHSAIAAASGSGI